MPESRRIRILICDDHRILGDAWRCWSGWMTASSWLRTHLIAAETAVAAIAELQPDVVLMDVDLPGMNGIEATRAIVTERPSTKVVVMSGSSDPDAMLVAAIGAGAAGFLPKTEAASKILGAVRAAAGGESLLDATTLMRVMRQVGDAKASRGALDQKTSRLTGREVKSCNRWPRVNQTPISPPTSSSACTQCRPTSATSSSSSRCTQNCRQSHWQ